MVPRSRTTVPRSQKTVPRPPRFLGYTGATPQALEAIIPPFEEAEAALREFLARKGHPTELLFVFREDVYGTSPDDLFVWTVGAKAGASAAIAHYARARRLGLAEIAALGCTDTQSIVTVFSPAPDEIQGWDRGLKITLRQPFARVTLVRSRLIWRLHRCRPQFRRWQENAFFIDRRPSD